MGYCEWLTTFEGDKHPEFVENVKKLNENKVVSKFFK